LGGVNHETDTYGTGGGRPLAAAAAWAQAPAVQAQTRDDGSRRNSTSYSGIGPQLAPQTIARYRVGFAKSRTGELPQTATVITVVNEAATPCTISVDWLTFYEGNAIIGSTATRPCAKLTISARTYYLSLNDRTVSGVPDPAITQFAVGNAGN
jgi:hypothetical protein